MPGDYYQTLNVSREASKEEIKQSFRRLARQYHPDVNKEPGAEDRFKEINRAYEVLSDPEVKARYDRFGEAGVSSQGGGAEYGDMGGFADIFETIFSGFGGMGTGATSGDRRKRGASYAGDDLRLDLTLSFQEAIFGGEKEIRIPHLESCQTCQGSGAKPGTGVKSCGTCTGTGQVRRTTRTPFGSFAQVASCPTCNGAGEVIEEKCASCNGAGRKQETKKLKITIPAGVDNGTRLRVPNEGDAGIKGGNSGDLYVFLSVGSDPEFRRNGLTIESEITISYLQAILGAHITVNTVDGEETLLVPAGTQPNTVLTLENKGVFKLGNSVSRGNHLITVKIAIPTPSRVNAEERKLLEELARIKGEQTNKGGLEGFLGGFFHK
jgi:molecular chaperone DnaJ